MCEITSASGSGCSQNNNPGTNGYKTSYTYDPLGNLSGVNQSGQTRTYAYDGLSRMTSETNPESGTKAYYYDSTVASSCSGARTSNGDLVRTADANGTNTCYYSDGLHRVTDVATNRSGTDRCQRFSYDNSQGVLGTRPSGMSVNNPLGRLVEAATDTCASPLTQSSVLTDEWFSYDVRGQASDYYQSSATAAAGTTFSRVTGRTAIEHQYKASLERALRLLLLSPSATVWMVKDAEALSRHPATRRC